MLDLQLIRFAAVGFLNTLIGLSVIFAAKALLGLDDIAANMLGYAIGILAGFAANKRWTFEDASAGTPAFCRYVLVLVTAYVVNLATTMCAINLLGMNSYVAQALGIVPYTLTGYFGSRHFVFRFSTSV